MFPSLLTFLRLLLAFLAFNEIVHKKFLSGFFIVLIGALTDFLDGFTARRFGQTSKFGAHLDHITDKIFVLSVLYAFVLNGSVSHFLFYLLAFREVAITLLRFYGLASSVNLLGKWKTTLEFVALLTLCVDVELGNLLLWISLFAAYLSAFLYVWETLLVKLLSFTRLRVR